MLVGNEHLTQHTRADASTELPSSMALKYVVPKTVSPAPPAPSCRLLPARSLDVTPSDHAGRVEGPRRKKAAWWRPRAGEDPSYGALMVCYPDQIWSANSLMAQPAAPPPVSAYGVGGSAATVVVGKIAAVGRPGDSGEKLGTVRDSAVDRHHGCRQIREEGSFRENDEVIGWLVYHDRQETEHCVRGEIRSTSSASR
ncbi:hypothetical protein BX600DRAFT_151528 [Xylariales sp. PMI_506]|nr:hypothetical protein BX600DRAFT_151528 [Xylariales sp. PMI_506]